MTDDELKTMIYRAFEVDENDPLVQALERLHEAERALREADKERVLAVAEAAANMVTEDLYRQYPDLPAGIRFEWTADD
ncbi:MAG TPA: hypothetical protein VGH54_23500 [Mycobacterium sp.]|uniref:hypothetical protein n=1 Tax=Mycobacterium sp. TaxID=1785 RepID=UPI002F40F409